MKIQDKLNSLRPYVIGIRYVQNLQIVDAVFKKNWLVNESKKVKKEIVDASQNYYMFYSEDTNVTVDELLDHVEHVIDLNVEREKKQELLKQKVKELQKVELPPREKKLEVEEFKEPPNIVCKCEPEDVCPVCEEEKIGSY